MSDKRNKLIQLIHVAKRDLQLDDDTYRVLLQKQTGKLSTKDMTTPQLNRVLQHMKNHGFTVKSNKDTNKSYSTMDSPQFDKLRVIWRQLHECGEVHNPSDEALATFLRRSFKVSATQWLDSEQLSKGIEMLKNWHFRAN